MIMNMVKILDYSETDFPSLDGLSHCAVRHHSKPANTAAPRRFTAGCEQIQRRDVVTSRPDRGSRPKVLNPCEHKETYSINICDALMKSVTQNVKSKPNGPRCAIRTNCLGGNPLDADNPVRQKGKYGMPKKPKRVSKTKKYVLEHRQKVLETKELVKNAADEVEEVHCKSELQNEEFLNVFYSSKLAEMRKLFKCSNPKESKGAVENETSRISPDGDEVTRDFLFGTKPENIAGICETMKSVSVPMHVLLIHNHNFKRYCDNWITKDLNEASIALVAQIVRFQQNKYQKNPVKAIADKRFVLGLKQTIKYTKMNKTKLIILVPDMEDGMFDLVEELKSLASTYCVPYAFALTRRKLGSLTCKKVGVCCFGLLDYSSAEDNFNRVKEATRTCKRLYREKCSAAEDYCRNHLAISPQEQSQDQSGAEVELQLLNEHIREKLCLNTTCDSEN